MTRVPLITIEATADAGNPCRRLQRHFGFALSALFIAMHCGNANAFCFKEAAARYNVSETLLRAIAITESRMNPTALNCANTNRTCDIGVMQINSSHLGELKAFGITERRLYDACTNVQVGAWILAQQIQEFGTTWKAVGAYNTGKRGSAANQRIYVAKVHRNYIALGGA